MKAEAMKATCRACAHFRNDPAYLEAIFQGLNVMSSAWASVVAEDGLCLRHDRYLSAEASCADFVAASSDARDAARVTPSAGPGADEIGELARR